MTIKSYSLGFVICPENSKKCYEPEPRVHGGRLMHHGHRFPIKNGISMVEENILDSKILMKEIIGISLYMK